MTSSTTGTPTFLQQVDGGDGYLYGTNFALSKLVRIGVSEGEYFVCRRLVLFTLTSTNNFEGGLES